MAGADVTSIRRDSNRGFVLISGNTRDPSRSVEIFSNEVKSVASGTTGSEDLALPQRAEGGRRSGTAPRAEGVDEAAHWRGGSRSRNAKAFRYGITRKHLRGSGTGDEALAAQFRAEGVDEATHWRGGSRSRNAKAFRYGITRKLLIARAPVSPWHSHVREAR